jgi:hypothetical protein
MTAEGVRKVVVADRPDLLKFRVKRNVVRSPLYTYTCWPKRPHNNHKSIVCPALTVSFLGGGCSAA